MILIAVASVAGAGAEMGLRPHRYQAVAQVLVTPVPLAQANYAGLQIHSRRTVRPGSGDTNGGHDARLPERSRRHRARNRGSLDARIFSGGHHGPANRRDKRLGSSSRGSERLAGGANRQHVRQRDAQPAPAGSAR